MLINFEVNDVYVVIRNGSDYYIKKFEPQSQIIVNSQHNEVIIAKTEYKFDVDVDTNTSMSDAENNSYAKVVNSTFKVHMIAQLPPYQTIQNPE